LSNFISTLKKGWWAFSLPGYRSRKSTYNLYSYHELPELNVDLDNDFDWLRTQSAKKHSLAENPYPNGEKLDVSKIQFDEKTQKIKLPQDFALFISDADLQSKVRTCTDCYLELPDFAVKTYGMEDGYLVHFLSDSQYGPNMFYIGSYTKTWSMNIAF
jgi:hypothetical protein